MCIHSKWANEQTLKTELCIPIYLSVHAFVYHYNIPSPKYQSYMTNPHFFQNAFVTSSRKSKNAMHAVKNDTQV